VLVGLSFLLIVIIVSLWALPGDRRKFIGLLLIVVGGSLNLLQWWQTGCVRDYIDFMGLFKFNVYDLLVSAGIIYLLYLLYVGEKRHGNK